jgi:two-component system CheB/CheR fusion protein
MPDALLRYAQHPNVSTMLASKTEGVATGGIATIFAGLRTTYGIDFSVYKPSTVFRRIDRRMSVTSLNTLEAYASRVAQDPDELDALFRDLLIGVTTFFRDGVAFDVLERDVVPALVEHAESEEIRVWVPGCATGEEAYSLAILFDEGLRKAGSTKTLRVFATDVHRGSLDRAASGVFSPDAVANVSPERLAAYFVEDGGLFRVHPELRRRVVFAPHDLTRDPPFTKLDLVSCRNLLIYFEPLAQRRVLSAFHFSLRPGGYLFLGTSETVGDLADEFAPVDTRWKLYRKKGDRRLATDLRFGVPTLHVEAGNGLRRAHTLRDARMSRLYDALLARFMPPGLLVDERRELVYTFGEAGAYLSPAPGLASLDVLTMVEGDLRIALSAAVQRALRDRVKVTYGPVKVARDDEATEMLRIGVDPIPDRVTGSTLLLITFEKSEAVDAEPDHNARRFDLDHETRNRVDQLESELKYTREHLQTTVEELETSNEELQASNEELLASNEELQSTNEELHSVNEELYTVNAEYEKKIVELSQITSDLVNLMSSTQVGTVFVDQDLRVRRYTPAAASVFNLVEHDVGRPLAHITNELVDAHGIVDFAKRTLEKGERFEQQVKTRDGRDLLQRITPYRDELGQIGGVVLAFIDMTDLQRVNAALTDSEERTRTVLEAMTDAVLVVDRDDRVVLANGSMLAVLAETQERVLDQPLAQALSRQPALLEHWRDGIERVFRTGEVIQELDAPCAIGTEHWCDTVISPIRADHSPTSGVMILHRDVTRRRQEEQARRDLDERLRESQKLESLGLIAGGIAHDFNNLLMAVLGNADLAMHELPANSLARDRIAAIEGAAQQAANLCRQLLAYAGKGRFVLGLHDLSAVVSDLAKMLDVTVAKKASLRLELDPELALVRGDGSQLRQVLMNLVVNATEAMQDFTGRIVVRTGSVLLDRKLLSRLLASESAHEGEYVYLEVSDSGCGMGPDTARRMFEPFFTTKFAGRGLGLAAVLGIIKGHGGAVAVESEPGRGTTVRVYLPAVSDKPEAKARSTQPPHESWRPRGTVLLVDDEEMVRNVGALMLRRIGFDVETAIDGLEAIDKLRAGGRYEFIVLDLTMPRLGGAETFRELRALDPEVPIIVASGFTTEDVTTRFADVTPDAFIQKPFALAALRHTLHKISATRARAASAE